MKLMYMEFENISPVFGFWIDQFGILSSCDIFYVDS
jgi:hypothetical protein